ncbi:transposase-like protein [Variovorax sp. BK613]|nr:transposase-like protein [Variovorax sp. BK613]
MFKRELAARSLVAARSVVAGALAVGINSNLLFAQRRMELYSSCCRADLRQRMQNLIKAASNQILRRDRHQPSQEEEIYLEAMTHWIITYFIGK